jgi:hypothetical protein
MEGCHIVEEPGVHEVVRAARVSEQYVTARSRKPPMAFTVCRKVGTLRS